MKKLLFLTVLFIGAFALTPERAEAQVDVSALACATDNDGLIDLANSPANCYFRPDSVEFEFVYLSLCEGYPVLPAMENCVDTGLVKKWYKLEKDKVSDAVEYTNELPSGTYTHLVAMTSVTTKIKAIAHLNTDARGGTGSGVQLAEDAGPYCTMQADDWSMSGYHHENQPSWSARCFDTRAEAAAVPAPEMDLDNLIPGEDLFVGVIPENGYADKENIVAILDADRGLATANTNAEYLFFITERNDNIVIPEDGWQLEIGWNMEFGARIGFFEFGNERYLPIVFIGANTMVINVLQD